LAPFIW